VTAQAPPLRQSRDIFGGSRVDHHWKIRARKQRTDVGKYSFVNRSIIDWNLLPEGVIGTSHGKTHIFIKRVRKVKTSERK
jgi:hypothetical protein